MKTSAENRRKLIEIAPSPAASIIKEGMGKALIEDTRFTVADFTATVTRADFSRILSQTEVCSCP
jgi:hypothetical protein